MSELAVGNADTDEEEHPHPWPHIESMFTLVKVRKNSYIMRCLLCLPKQTDISAFKNSTSNLRKHVARIHPNKLAKYTDLLENHRKLDATAAGGAANETYKRLSRSAFAKCHALWNKTSRSTMAHETVERECKLQFLRPNQTRWSSLFLAVERIVRIHREQGEQAIRNVCTALKIKM
ncbi:hypothetical protein J4Q44_G00010940 [Coregonus suidteri]|uniref:BED-type domain-containing protein n=1 Tax=Coregonus suidteri TaxID=861788 RepID=A0AAN8NJJ5_9TELE